MKYVIRERTDTDGWFRVEPEDRLMEQFDYPTLSQAVEDALGTMRFGDTIELVSDFEGREGERPKHVNYRADA